MIKRLFLDIDGVLADFIGAAFKAHGKTFNAATYPKGLWNTWEHIGCTEQEFWEFDGYDFWRNLEPYPYAKLLVKCLEDRVFQENICLLTSPSLNAMRINGKRDWIAEHFPAYTKQVLFGSAKHFCAHPTTVLIDDSDKNCEAFSKAGGHYITFPRVWNSAGERDDPATHVVNVFDYFTTGVNWHTAGAA